MANTVRFIHAADVHLGTAFKQAGSTDESLGTALTRATYEAFDRVVAYALSEGVDFLVLAGDTFNSAGMNLPAQSYLATKLSELVEANIGVFMVHGNHDPAAGKSRTVPLPPEVHVFSAAEVEEIEVEGARGTCTLFGRSFLRSDERENLAVGFRRGRNATNAVAVLHANVGGSAQADPYSPCSVKDLAAARMDYWALGHIHMESVVSAANPLAIYPGSTQALTINETGRHGCYLVELTDGVASAQWLPTGAVGVAHVEVNLTGCSSIGDAVGVATESVRATLREADTPFLVRLILTGRREFKTVLGDGTLDQLAAAVQGLLADRTPRIWVDTTVLNRSRLDRMDEVENSANPFIRTMVELADTIDVQELLDTSKRLGRTAGNSTAVSVASATLLAELGDESDDLLLEAKEYAVSLLLGEGE